MPSRPLQQRLTLRLKVPGGRELAKVAAALLLAAVLGACASGKPPTPVREPERKPQSELALGRAERAYLIDPMEGYAQEIDPSRRERIEEAHRALLEEADLAGARETAAELLEEDPGLHPAQVLAAQVDFAEGLHREVMARLLPIGDQMPGYVASQLLLGRAAEQAGDVPIAYAAYRAVATRNPLAFRRLRELHPRAVEILANRLRDAVRAGQLAEAEKSLALLRSWAPSERVTLEGAIAVAEARGDRAAELAAVKDLAAQQPNDRKLLERRAELELAVGDPGAGLQIIQGLAEKNPNDPALAEKLAAAKFRWRLTMLPQSVQGVAGKGEINKADFAVLLYWLVPSVRYARPTAGRIATDVLDHPHQEEIVRVVNLGLMDVDSTLHRFSPGAPLRRGAALRSLVHLMATSGQGIACLRGQSSPCAAAAACGLIAEGEDCQAGAALSGGEAVDLIRRAQKHLGGS